MSDAMAHKIKTLREKTGAGYAHCHKALTDANGDIEAASDLLRVRGLSASAAKMERETSSGVVCIVQDKTGALMIKLQSETDFVAMNQDFTALALKIGNAFISSGENSLGNVLSDSNTVGEAIQLLSSKVGENIRLGDVTSMNVEQNSVVGAYVHREYVKGVGKIGVLVKMVGGQSDEVQAFANNVAMHIAAMKPIALRREDADSAVIAREREVHVTKAAASGKPSNVVEKIVDGSMNKFYSNNILLEQVFVISEKQETIQDILNELSRLSGNKIEIESYTLYMVG